MFMLRILRRFYLFELYYFYRTFTPVCLAESQDQDLLYEDESCTVGSKKDSKDLDNSSFIYVSQMILMS